MTDRTLTRRTAGGSEALLAAAVDAYLLAARAGEAPDLDAFADRHPAVADDLRRLLPALALVNGSEVGSLGGVAPHGRTAAGGTLGDYRIVREIGRGGMGVVYEAEQISLRRRVALKVLPFAAVTDPRSLQRFRNEALAAAGLDHPHVMKVYGVGCERGVHYIALQFIDGRPMSDLIDDRRGATPGTDSPTVTATAPADSTAPGRPSRRQSPPAASSRRGDTAYYRRVAEWGADAADALEHAHALGVVHRDVKPGNLLVDGAGKVYVVDFGLAKLTADPGMTGTGDLLGTVRYMSPEQAAAKHDLVDHRSDLYSLGVTLYELLTLVPAFSGPDRQAVLTAVLTSEPASLRTHDRGTPPDLETIVLKLMEKEPARRYQTAADLAADLRRFLRHQPIVARRPSLSDRVGKWVYRHRSTVGSAAAILVAVTTVSVVAAGIVWNQNAERKEALAQKTTALGQREQALARADANFRKALDVTGAMVEALGPYRRDVTPDVAATRRAVLDQARAFFVGFLQDHRADPELRRETLLALGHLSMVHARQREYLPAAERLGEALTLANELKAEFATDPRFRADFDRLHQSIDQVCFSLTEEARNHLNEKRFGDAEGHARTAFNLTDRWESADSTLDEFARAFALQELARTLEETQRLAEAARCWRISVACCERQARKDPVVASGANQLRYEHRVSSARLLLRLGELDECEAVIGDELAFLGGPNPGGEQRYFATSDEVVRGTLLARKTEVLRARGKVAESDKVAKLALTLLPPDSTDHRWLRLLATDAGLHDPVNVARSATARLAAVDKKPTPNFWDEKEEAAILTQLGLAEAQQGNWKGAAEALKRALAIRPDGVRGTLFHLAAAYVELGQREDARRCYAEAVKQRTSIEPKNHELIRLNVEVAKRLGVMNPELPMGGDPPSPKR